MKQKSSSPCLLAGDHINPGLPLPPTVQPGRQPFVHASGCFISLSTLIISQLKAQTQGSSEELKCLQLIHRLQEVPDLEELMGNQSCLKLASSLKSYVNMVTENVIRRSPLKDAMRSDFNTSTGHLATGALGRASAHLSLRQQSPSQDGGSGHFGELSRSCRHPVTRWEDRTVHTHLQNVTYQAGKLRVSQAGKYYIYSQIYFRYPGAGAAARLSGHQLVQCINRETAYGQPILLLKGVGTKCWAPEAADGLHTLYQGGLFELQAGDQLFVSVSSPAIDYDDTAASYFGAFLLDP
uniref:Tumor necrosis factor ligand superfamily member 10 n=1 Tax=Pelodiscus sinensis TaxID=13735 RepID=K7G3V7_PELSI|nr:tumor necrosis factor ligand superfamily member 11-like [Pelodiscus sinensis]|eukprot:XP_014426479.1 tumor necrosis factor ligand superfamily member 11-like [Pelodiscus sinensis]